MEQKKTDRGDISKLLDEPKEALQNCNNDSEIWKLSG